MKKIIMFVMVLAISAPALADDLNPPDWAGGPGTIYGIWEFPSADSGQYGDYPEEGGMKSHGTHPDPEEYDDEDDPDPGEVAHQYMMVNEGGADSWLASHDGREGVVAVTGINFGAYNFPGAGSKIIRLQLTYTGSEISTFYFSAEGGSYGTFGEWNGSAEGYHIETIDLGGGWFHSTYDFPIPANPGWEQFWVGPPSTTYYDQIVIDTICYPGAEPPDGPGRGGLPSPIVIDPNESMLVYEEDETESGFGVSLLNEPLSGATITVTVDPNANGDWPNEDITLPDGTGGGNTITLTFDNGNWDVPQMVIFKAIEDDIPEPPALTERIEILLSSSWPGHESDANYVGEKIVTVSVMDNDQANIIFTITPPELGSPKNPVTGPVQIWEEPRDFWGSPVTRWRKIGVTLQVQPTGGDVEIIVTNDDKSGNQPIMDPPLTTASDPNSLIFTAGNWDVSQNIEIWGNDDAELQVLGEYGEYPSYEGGQNYQDQIVFTVVDDGGDTRFTDMVRTVDINIQDNECGAFGILAMDVGNSDPCAIDEDGNPLPDCYVDIYDVIEVATKWLDCSDISDESCESYL